MKIPNRVFLYGGWGISLARIVSEDSQPELWQIISGIKSSKDS